MQAKEIARAKDLTLSTVVSEALSEGLRMNTAAERSKEVLNAYKSAFFDFLDEEMAILDGVILSCGAKR
jgi:hypothetical protein